MEGKSELKFVCDLCGKEVENGAIEMVLTDDSDGTLYAGNVCRECYERED